MIGRNRKRMQISALWLKAGSGFGLAAARIVYLSVNICIIYLLLKLYDTSLTYS